MKKFNLLIILLVVCLVMTGCKMSKKEIAEAKTDMTSYIKKNMGSNWTYAEDKVDIDDELNTKIKLFNVLDESECVLESKSAYESLKANLPEKSYLSNVSIYCEFKDQKIGHANVKDLKKVNIDNLYSEASFYGANDNKLTVNDEFFATQKKDFISKCQKYSYKEIFRNSDQYIGKHAVFKGKVFQVIDNGDMYDFIIEVNKDEYGFYEDSIYASIEKSYFNGRILDDDIITIYGKLNELYSYEAVSGQTITIPSMYVRYAELNK